MELDEREQAIGRHAHGSESRRAAEAPRREPARARSSMAFGADRGREGAEGARRVTDRQGGWRLPRFDEDAGYEKEGLEYSDFPRKDNLS
jgi:hypothetical protein